MLFNGNKVWVASDPEGVPIVKIGKVLIKYQLDQEHEYWVREKSLKQLDSGNLPAQKEKSKIPPIKQKRKKAAIDSENTIHLYTDGACSGNPGPAGIGILLRYGDKEKRISHYIGIGTNNIAELEAVKTGLLAIKSHTLPVKVYTDSSYVMGLLSLGWKPKKNTALVMSIKELIKKFHYIEFIKVKGHSGHRENEIVDQLAVSAIQQNNAPENHSKSR